VSNEHTWGRGRVFAVPLLMGGYAFGYITRPGGSVIPQAMAVILEGWSESPEPPHDLETRAVVMEDLLVGCEDRLTPIMRCGRPWILTSRVVVQPRRRKRRHWRMGAETRGFYEVDIDRPGTRRRLSREEAMTLPPPASHFPGTTVAEIEVPVKKLEEEPRALYDRWLQAQPPVAPTNGSWTYRAFVVLFVLLLVGGLYLILCRP